MTSMTPGERVPPMGWTAAALTMEPSAFCDPNGNGGYQRAGGRAQDGTGAGMDGI